MDKNIISLKEAIKKAKHIVFFGGAGVSTESGIPDFRGKDGLYKLKSKYGMPYEIMLSHDYFVEHTETFYKFYYEFMINKDAKPNYAHTYLAKLEKQKDVTVITQNIDGLHQLAGSKNVIELHGSVLRNYCTNCCSKYTLDEILKLGPVPYCPKCHGLIKPDVVLYDEGLDENTITKAMIALQEADLLIIAGTSLRVYPAASFINYFFGDNVYVINKDPLQIDRKIKCQINAPIGEVFKEIDN
ncbi:MAG: NAD-dependent protein deacylase [Bacilli bacterium]